MPCEHEQEPVREEEEEVTLLVQPPQKLAQPAFRQLGDAHPYAGKGELEVRVLGEQKAAEERGRERSDDQTGHHHGELKLEPVSSARRGLHWLAAQYTG